MLPAASLLDSGAPRMTEERFNGICHQKPPTLSTSSRAAKRTVDAPQLPVLPIIVERASPATMTFATVSVAIIPPPAVEINVDPLLLGVDFIEVHPFECQRITATDQIEDADGVIVDAPPGVTTVRVSALATVPLPPDVVVAVVFECTDEDRRAPAAVAVAAREVFHKTDIEKANAGFGFGVAREDASSKSDTAVDGESGCQIRRDDQGNGVGGGVGLQGPQCRQAARW